MSRTVRVPDPTTETIRPSGVQRIERRLGSQEENEITMDRCMAACDYDGALVAATALLQRNPNHESARKIKACIAAEGAMRTTSATPSLKAIPKRLVGWEALPALALHREDAYLLTFIDGRSNLEAIVDMVGLPSHVVANSLERLMMLGVVAF